MIAIDIYVFPGTLLTVAAQEAIATSARVGAPVRFAFNGVSCLVNGSDRPAEIVRLVEISQDRGYSFMGQARRET
jgi:hypothetical protein